MAAATVARRGTEERREAAHDARRAMGPWSLVLSALAHVLAIGGVGVLAYRSLAAREAREVRRLEVAPPTEIVVVDLPVASAGDEASDEARAPEGSAPAAYGGSVVARVDTGVPGAGGDRAGERATNLAASAEALRLSPDLLSRLDRDQEQRLRTAAYRTTREDRRSARDPMELTFLASGRGERQERRPVAERDPSRGVMEAPTASVVGGRLGAPAEPERDAEAEGKFPGAATTGRLSESPGRGVREGAAGEDHRRSARVANGRPSVAEGTPSVTATYTARPNDNVDSEQEVAATVRSLVHASVAGGAVGAGRGGDGERATAPGAGGGVGQGSVARPMGRGDGDVFDLYTSDPMLVPYFRKLKAKIDPLWADAFPKSALAELKQGTVILEFTIGADGSAKVAWPPRRPSGVDAFDRNCADAIRRAAPFDPIPATLRERGYTRVRILAPFEAKNPIVK